jgi:hypothetical protein
MSQQRHLAKPEQAWAHKYGRVRLGNHAAVRPHEVASRLELQDLFSRWGIAHDEGRMDVIAGLFTADAVFEVTEGAQTRARFEGRDRIVQEIERVFKYQADQRRHFMTNVLVDNLDEEKAACIAYGVVVVDGLTLGATVIYSADCRRDSGIWQFSRFTVGLDNYAGTRPDDVLVGAKGSAT